MSNTQIDKFNLVLLGLDFNNLSALLLCSVYNRNIFFQQNECPERSASFSIQPTLHWHWYFFFYIFTFNS